LRVSTNRLNEAQRMAHVGNWSRDAHSGQLLLSDELFHLFEIDPQQFDPASADLLDIVHPEDRDAVEHTYADSLAARTPYEISHRLLMRDGRVKWVQQRGTAEFDAAGQPLRSIGTVQDITRSVLDQQALIENEERLRIIADYTYDWEYWQGVRGELIYMSPSCERITGYTREEFIADPALLHNIILPEDRHLMAAHLQDIGHEDEGTLDFRIARKDGQIRWIAHGCRCVYWHGGRFMGRRASNRDITERKQAEEQVRQLAYYDMLTGLPNRRLLLDRLQLALTQARRHTRPMAVLFLDLDHFKNINDTHGHDVGDALLKQVADRLRTCVRDGDTVARQSGDEFVIVLTEIKRPEAAAQVAAKIIDAIRAPMHIGDRVLDIMASVGIAVYPADADDTTELMKKADQAMYAAKAAGRNNYRFYRD
jgi:diguanylate cyclase (GGDEF)-like protein/PAS domain S-box-containing protein